MDFQINFLKECGVYVELVRVKATCINHIFSVEKVELFNEYLEESVKSDLEFEEAINDYEVEEKINEDDLSCLISEDEFNRLINYKNINKGGN